MQDKPSALALVESIIRYMRDELVPALDGAESFKARVAANTLDIVRREIADAGRASTAEQARLATLLGRVGELEALNRQLCAEIRAGRLTLATPGLADHLWRSTMDKLTIDQPSYASYRRLMEGRK